MRIFAVLLECQCEEGLLEVSNSLAAAPSYLRRTPLARGTNPDFLAAVATPLCCLFL